MLFITTDGTNQFLVEDILHTHTLLKNFSILYNLSDHWYLLSQKKYVKKCHKKLFLSAKIKIKNLMSAL